VLNWSLVAGWESPVWRLSLDAPLGVHANQMQRGNELAELQERKEMAT
jgi:DNA polymerase III psi subunit